ncbi:MAG: carbohydrate kinase family protein, partial [Anaerolineae bacterium]|nr:carbohydrate kinase family protein [Anaerolineae bacterium]
DPARLASAGRCAPAQVGDWSGRELLAPCFAVDVVGTTGSGDCTIAGFLAGVLKALAPEETMTAAVAVGACNVEKADATSGIPHWSAVRKRLDSAWARRPVSCSLPEWTWDEKQQIWRAD